MKPSQQRWASLRFRHKIRNVLLTYYLTPILLVVLASGAFFYLFARKSLDDELGQRLVSVAMAASYHIQPYQVAALEIRDPDSLTYRSIRDRLDKIRADNQVARIYLFSGANESLLDTDPSVPIGSPYGRNRLNLAELEQVRAGRAAASVLFEGDDGLFYKSAFAPVTDGTRVLAVVGVDGSATFFRNLNALGKRIILFGLACIAIVVLVSLMISRRIVVPVQLLVQAATRIGEGHLDTPVDIRAQNEIGFLGFVLDEMRKNIVARDRDLQMMLRGIAHEVRNPLGGIELFAGMLEEEAQTEPARNAVRRIQREVRTLKSLVEEFLDFARKQSLQISDVPLEPFLGDVRVAFQKELEGRSIRFRVSADGIRDVRCDPDQMRRVFLNLVRNALQAVPDGGAIDVVARTENGNVEITVSDNGSGIPRENLDKIFDPFFTTKEAGTGLGLSFVSKIVSAHGGDVKVQSAPGEGTQVSILLPR